MIAVLITCHNRREKTLSCLNALFAATLPPKYTLNVFLVDDGSVDGTGEAVKKEFPEVHVIQGDGNLFWAGGMRLAWNVALSKKKYDGYLLLNDDTTLYDSALLKLLETHSYSLEYYNKGGIYIGSTKDIQTNKFTYGGHKIINKYSGKSVNIIPKENEIQSCDFANANIFFVSKNVVESIGILFNKYIHSIADYDYSLRASKAGFPILVCSSYLGTCENDHKKNWLSYNYSLKERIIYLKNSKGLAYKEYLFYIKRHYPFYLPIIFIKLWAKTIFPFIWDKFKNK